MDRLPTRQVEPLQSPPTGKKSKFPIKTAGIALAIVLLIELAGPQVLLQLSKPKPAPAQGSPAGLSYFPDSYEASRQRFIQGKSTLKSYGSGIKLTSYPVGGENGLYIDAMKADATKTMQNLIILTSGMHGVEGYVGSAMIELFRNEFMPKLDPTTTGVIWVHAANPWGMKHNHRYNEDHVDLNRNFFDQPDAYGKQQNPSYQVMRSFLEKPSPVGNAVNHEVAFFGDLIGEIIRHGTGTISEALLQGQYENPQGVYYGGAKAERSTQILQHIYEEALNSGYARIVHVDLHTGYGPRDQMSIFSASKETMTEEQASQAFQYPLVLTPTSKDYYATSGDNTEYFYTLKQRLQSSADLYSTTFEFGTMGVDTWGSVRSLRNTIDENSLYANGSTSPITEQIILNRYKEMFDPSDAEWRLKAVADFRQAMSGVLKYKGMLAK
ncbi:M14 family metallopeptidase [Paenibacillus aestuarii]|uniref:M14 family metallopeptidase n=1 Tax=Paenibacillus aestuarii TaxID=516965 RepID=A0ABW0KHG9_9BACL|nr:M14 family metallopeptidase [Paenibacillus aestuarii]